MCCTEGEHSWTTLLRQFLHFSPLCITSHTALMIQFCICTLLQYIVSVSCPRWKRRDWKVKWLTRCPMQWIECSFGGNLDVHAINVLWRGPHTAALLQHMAGLKNTNEGNEAKYRGCVIYGEASHYLKYGLILLELSWPLVKTLPFPVLINHFLRVSWQALA